MKQQISRLSPHQNGKVFGVLGAITSLILLVPFFLIASVAGAGQAVPLWGIIIAPIIYLVFGYIFTVIGCALYNVVAPMTGGIEYDSNASTA